MLLKCPLVPHSKKVVGSIPFLALRLDERRIWLCWQTNLFYFGYILVTVNATKEQRRHISEPRHQNQRVGSYRTNFGILRPNRSL